jgi:hypothetical protein
MGKNFAKFINLRNLKYQKAKIGICRFCIKDGSRINLVVHGSDLGPDVKWCPRCGTCADWWMLQEYHWKKMLEFYENKKREMNAMGKATR